MTTPPCPLCNAVKKEKKLLDWAQLVVVETKNKKGHRRRIMAVSKDHPGEVEVRIGLIKALIERGKHIFTYTPKFVIMEGTYGSIKNHEHLVASDLDPDSEDFAQILKTPWIAVADTVSGKIMVAKER